MITNRQLFLNNVAQTSDIPLMLEIEKAKGIYMYDIHNKKYIDLISGVSVSNLGHTHPKVVESIKEQTEKYMHLMVYGEYIQSPQVKLSSLLAELLPESLNNVFLVNSGSEATEGALKLAKRYTGRHEIIAFKNAYHGSTHGALSVLGDEYFKQSYRPLLPGIKFLEFNNFTDLQQITEKTACVITEVIQSEAGINLPEKDYLKQLRKRCTETGTLLIIDEVQTGFGRTGKMFGFENYEIIPDIVNFAKGMGGGMPIGAFVSSKKIMHTISENPVLGHITTFGGHPVSAAAAYATINELKESNIIKEVNRKGNLFKKLLKHRKIKSMRGIGLFYSVELENFEQIRAFILKAIELGAVTDWFLFSDNRFRIAPPLIITEEEIKITCDIILKTLDLI